MDDDSSPLDSSLPWLWIIEYLAGFKEVDTSILHDLIEMAPELPDDLGKNTREMVALRCLEDLFGSSNGIINDVPSVPDSKVGFDLSESCEDVLQCILQETSVSDLKMAGPELLKWDVHPFITHKRASVPKCALQQLKDTILEGTHPDAVSLKESSGLVCVNESDRMPVDDGDHNLHTCRPDGSGNDTQIMPEGNLIPLTNENGNGLPGDNLHSRNLSPSKRDRSDLATENLAGHIHESQDGTNDHDDLQVNVKKLKHDASCIDQSVGQSSVPVRGDELLESLSERVIRVTEGEGCDLQKDSQVGILEGSMFSEDGSKRLGQSSDVETEKLQYNQIEVDHNTNKMPQDTSGDRPVQFGMVDETNDAEPRTLNGAPSMRNGLKDSVDESKDKSDHGFEPKLPNAPSLDGLHQKINPDGAEDGMEHLCEEEISSDSDEYHDARIDIAKKKSHFLSSECTLSQNSLATEDWTQQNLCVKCNNNGQLLVCSTSGCPLVVHENCLGSPAKFDNKGNFYCPFCAYSLAISEYLEAKRKASLARKELAAFIHMNLEHHPKKLTGSSGRKDHSCSSLNRDKDLLAKIHENGHLGGRKHNQANQNGEHVNELNDHPFQKSTGDNQQSEPSASCVNVNLPCREEEANAISGKIFVSTGEKEEDKMIQECLTEGQRVQVQAEPKCDGDNLSCKNMEIVPVNCIEDEGGIQKEVLQQQISDPKETPVCALNIDGEETSAGENDKFIISNYSIRFRRRETQYTYTSTPQLRRKKLPWTAKEEEILRKGVQKLSRVDDRNIPWKKILEFGSSVFLNGRTTVDLKDKWRNMCKSSPRSK